MPCAASSFTSSATSALISAAIAAPSRILTIEPPIYDSIVSKMLAGSSGASHESSAGKHASIKDKRPSGLVLDLANARMQWVHEHVPFRLDRHRGNQNSQRLLTVNPVVAQLAHRSQLIAPPVCGQSRGFPAQLRLALGQFRSNRNQIFGHLPRFNMNE